MTHLRFVVFALFAAFLMGCGDKHITNITEVYTPRELKLDSAAVTLYPGQSTRVSVQLSNIKLDSSETLSWESRSPTVATVASDGTIRALAPGYSLVTVYLMQRGIKTSLSAAVQVTVNARPATPRVVSISASPTVASLQVGDVLTPLAVVAVSPDTLSRGVLWQSESPSVATVSPSGVIGAISPGTANIRVIAVADTTRSVTIIVTVTPRSVTPPPTGGVVRSITVNPTEKTLKLGVVDSVAVTVVADPGVSTAYFCASTNTALVAIMQRADGKCTFRVIAGFSPAVNPPKLIFTTVGKNANGVSLTTEVIVRYSP